jgi:hypothetical protein
LIGSQIDPLIVVRLQTASSTLVTGRLDLRRFGATAGWTDDRTRDWLIFLESSLFFEDQKKKRRRRIIK